MTSAYRDGSLQLLEVGIALIIAALDECKHLECGSAQGSRGLSNF